MKYLNRNGNQEIDGDLLTKKVIGLAIEIHKELGPGFSETIYHRALELQLAEAKINFVSEAPLVVKFQEHVIGTYSVDLLIDNKLIVELKALEELPRISEVQVVSYLKAGGFDTGLILNFGQTTLQIKRKYRNRSPMDLNIRLHEV